MQAVRSFVTMTLQKDTKLTAASLYSSIILPFRYADNRFHLFLIRTFGNVVDELLKDIHTFHDFIHTNHVTCPGVSFGIDDFFEIYFVVYSIRLALAHITSPATGTSCAACGSEGDSVFTAQHSYAFQTLLCDNVAGEYLVILVDDSTQIGDELFHPLLEVGMQVSLYATDGVVVHDEASTTSFLKDVEYFFTITEAVEESGKGTEVHCQTRIEQQVRVDTL